MQQGDVMRMRPAGFLLLALIVLAGCGKVQPVDDGGDDDAVDAPDGDDAAGDVDTDATDVSVDDDPGPCTTPEDCDDDNVCTTDSCRDGTCEYTFNFRACSDDWECTTGETCDGAGNCTGGTPDDTACGTGELCRPECFPLTGCGTAPTSLVVDCPDTTSLTSPAVCSISLDGVAGQAACIDCTSEVGPVEIASDDFGDATGTCGMGGWSMVTGASCTDRVDDGAPCTPGGGPRTCCADAGTVATSLNSDCMLRTDARLNCGGSGDSREWRMERTIDTRGLTDIEVCFNTAHYGATDNDGILLHAEDSTHSEQAFCQMGPPTTGAPVDREWPHCVTLPAWAEDNPALVLRFIMHSHDDDDRLYLDDVVVRGWPSGCAASRTVAFEEDFDPCTSIIGDGWNGWTVTGNPGCRDMCTGGSPGAARATNETWSMSHAVDTSALARDVRLCFAAGESFASSSSDRIQVEIDTGSGWQEAWYWEQGLSFGGACVDVCVNLTDLDPAAARNPSLQIRFTVQASEDTSVYIDDIVLDGATLCDGAGSLRLGAPSDGGGGSYTIEVDNEVGRQLWGELSCSWDSPPEPVSGSDGTWFRP